MKHINEFIKIGRAPRVPLCTANVIEDDVQQAEMRCDAARQGALQQAIASGNDVSRIKFERVYIDTDELDENRQPVELGEDFKPKKNASDKKKKEEEEQEEEEPAPEEEGETQRRVSPRKHSKKAR